LTRRELERQVRFQVEEVVFELMSWREGFFSFEEREVSSVPAEASIRISTESLLMEGARRIDEWSRIEGKIPHLGVVPSLCAVLDDHAAQLDLLPNEWEVLSEIDGARDLRAIASELARSEFDVARIAYGLVTTGVVALRDTGANGSGAPAAAQAQAHLDRAREALRANECDRAVAEARLAVAGLDGATLPRLVLARALTRAGRHDEAQEELRRVLQADALEPAVHLETGCCAAWRGDYQEALTSWDRYLRLAPDGADAAAVRESVAAATRLSSVLKERMDV